MGNLSSLLSVSPPTTPTNANVNTLLNAPKPPKKRYLEDNELNGTSDTNVNVLLFYFIKRIIYFFLNVL